MYSVGRLACKLYENMRREASAVKIQKNVRRYEARKAYTKLHASVLTLQTALRAVAALKEFKFRKQTKASIIIQVRVDYYIIRVSHKGDQYSAFKFTLQKWQARWRCHKAAKYYKRLKKGAIVTQCRWRGRVARRELRKLKMVSFYVFHDS